MPGEVTAMKRARLNQLDFELAYLIRLTRAGLKPLSRYEGDLPRDARAVVRAQGLVLENVTRHPRFGRPRIETVFSRHRRYTDFYRRRFDGTPLRLTPDVIRVEGRLFGYPACCIEAFIREPYAANRLTREEQGILFHWACPECGVTPGLLREYARIHAECRRATARPTPRRTLAKAAASLALLAGSAGLVQADPHWMPVADDGDLDYLAVAEEILAGTDWSISDSDGDGTLDGVQLAQGLRWLIENPPANVTVIDYEMWGIEICSVCGETVNMGYVEITHTERGLVAQVPYIALHYLEHGSLSYDGDIHTGRIELQTLKQILSACDPAHLLPVTGDDPDADGLLTEEEPVLGTDPEDPDTDDDSLIDGPQVAEQLLPLIGELPREPQADRPYLQEFWALGEEQCNVCGQTMNMGGIEITNPLEELSLHMPFAALHGAAHGSFEHSATYNQGRLIPSILQTVLAGDGSAHWLAVPGDGDGDGLTDDEEPYFGFDPENPDENLNGIPDGRDLATDYAAQIDALPEGPLPDQIYVIHHPTYGFYNCVTCGEEINMGYLEIVNPLTGHTLEAPYYNLHFMERGSFSTDRADLYPRLDPRRVAEVLGVSSTSEPNDLQRAFAFSIVPNPCQGTASARMILALPGLSGEITAGIYTADGRRISQVLTGTVRDQAAAITWDGTDAHGHSVAAGSYFCKVQIGTMTLTRKIVIAE